MNTDESKLTQNVFLTLLALSNGPKHGYEISKFIETRSSGVFRISFGSLYPILHRLEEEKLILSRWEDMDSRKPKKTYTLSARGEKTLENEVQRQLKNATAIDRLSMKDSAKVI